MKQGRTVKKSAGPGDRFLNKNYMTGLIGAVIVVLAIVLAVGVNLLAGSLPAGVTKLDTTANRVNSLSDDTLEFISSLDTDVDVYLVSASGNEDSVVVNMLERYESGSGRIHTDMIDPALHPGFIGQYTSKASLSDNTLIISAAQRSYVVDYGDYNPGSTFLGEDYLNSAIRYVTSDSFNTIYCLTGHGELTLSDELVSSLALDGYDTQELLLLSGSGIPNDASGVFIFSPSSDISGDEASLLTEYLEGGGNLFLVTDYIGETLPNLASVMAGYGTQLVDGYVCEGETGISLSGVPIYIIPALSTESALKMITEGVSYVLIPGPQGIEKQPSYRSSLNIRTILSTSDSSYAKTNPNSSYLSGREPGDIDGPFSVGTAIEEEYNGVTTRLIWYSSSMLFDQSMDEVVSGSNTTLILNSFNWLCDSEVASLHAKSTASGALAVPTGALNTWRIVMIFAVPLTVLACGFTVKLRRKGRS